MGKGRSNDGRTSLDNFIGGWKEIGGAQPGSGDYLSNAGRSKDFEGLLEAPTWELLAVMIETLKIFYGPCQ